MHNFWWIIMHQHIFKKKILWVCCFLGPTIFEFPQPNWYYCSTHSYCLHCNWILIIKVQSWSDINWSAQKNQCTVNIHSFWLCSIFHCNLTVRFTFNCLIQSNVEVTVKNTVNQLYSYSTVLGTAIKCKPYSGIWDTFKNCKNYIEYICSVVSTSAVSTYADVCANRGILR